ncbi:MAG: hypothetical protein J6X28_01820 [Bacilli bacterium]|nr:hypothetical protein [Bacilli bacterium]
MGKEYSLEAGIRGQFIDEILTITEDWIYISPNAEKLHNLIYKDEEYGETIKNITTNLMNIRGVVTNTLGPEKDQEMASMISEMESIGSLKEKLSEIDWVSVMKQFNDQLEAAKVKIVRKLLKKASERFNAMKIMKESPDGISAPEYDVIIYDFGVEKTFLDLKASSLYTELINREVQYGIELVPQSLKDIMVRPADT